MYTSKEGERTITIPLRGSRVLGSYVSEVCKRLGLAND
jgi:hypothetical protein